MTTVISVENLSKSYRLGQIGGRTLSEDLNRWWARLRRKPDPYLKIGQEDHGNRQGEHIWALRNVSFQVQQGEVLGIIGRNGAGKSTLLKILSRITAPTSGQVKVKGRIASLLEVGTGFHPELTGRENVYLNGAIFGMNKSEVARKFDEIVDFAGIERFVDTPVKRYSSGMFVRLAFAVAAHLEPEILLVDEVLAVGDIAFQKKCLGKMQDVSDKGRTVFFVSHNMEAIKRLCPRVMVLDKGRILVDGDAETSIGEYITIDELGPAEMSFELDEDKPAQFCRILTKGANDIPCNRFRQDEKIQMQVDVLFRQELRACMLAVAVYSAQDFPIFTTTNWDLNPEVMKLMHKPGRESYQIEIPEKLLFPGQYYLRLGLGISGHYQYDYRLATVKFEVSAVGSIMSMLGDSRRGVITPILEWSSMNGSC